MAREVVSSAAKGLPTARLLRTRIIIIPSSKTNTKARRNTLGIALAVRTYK